MVLRGAITAFFVAAFCAWLAVPAAAAGRDLHGVPLPRHTAKIGVNTVKTRLSFHDATQFYQRWLRRHHRSVHSVPVYGYRGVTVARFLRPSAHRDWQAIHVFAARGQTYISVVPAKSDLDDPAKRG